MQLIRVISLIFILLIGLWSVVGQEAASHNHNRTERLKVSPALRCDDYFLDVTTPGKTHEVRTCGNLTLELKIKRKWIVVKLAPSRLELMEGTLASSKSANLQCLFESKATAKEDGYMAVVNLCEGVSGNIWGHGLSIVLEAVRRKNGMLSYWARVAVQYSEMLAAQHLGLTTSEKIHHRSKRSLIEEYPPGNLGAIEIFVVVDKSYYDVLGGTDAIVEETVLDALNHASFLLRTFDLYIAVVGLQLWGSSDRFEVPSERDQLGVLLGRFEDYRQKSINPFYSNDNAQLLTGKGFSRYSLGQPSGMCNYVTSVGVISDNTGSSTAVGAQLAQSIGHNLGLIDDLPGCSCGDIDCIMSKDISKIDPPTRWSNCSIARFHETSRDQSSTICFRNPPIRLAAPSCGNLLVDPGEECDCGPAESCTNPCCDPTICRLRDNAVCGSGECCDLTTCDYIPRSTLCRDVADGGTCDLPEFCSGRSSSCPTDAHKRDGTPCPSHGDYCYSGQCSSRDAQCQLLYGAGASSAPDVCYDENTAGSDTGHCGYLFGLDGARKFAKCDPKSILCGQLQCVVNNDDSSSVQIRGDLANFVSGQRAVTPIDGSPIQCQSALFELFGLAETSGDFGSSPNGARCGLDQYCVNYECMAAVAIDPSAAACDPVQLCNTNGVCDSGGLCYCEYGHAPPDCVERSGATGGSIHSNPPPDSQNSVPVITIVVVVVVVVVLAVLIATAIWKREAMFRLPDRIRKLFSNCMSRIQSGWSSKGPGLNGSSIKDPTCDKEKGPIGPTRTSPSDVDNEADYENTIPMLPPRDARRGPPQDTVSSHNDTRAPPQETIPALSRNVLSPVTQDASAPAPRAFLRVAPQVQLPAAPQDLGPLPAAPQDLPPPAPRDQLPAAPQDLPSAARKGQLPAAPRDLPPPVPRDQLPAAPRDQLPAAPQDLLPAAPRDQLPAVPQDSLPDLPLFSKPGLRPIPKGSGMDVSKTGVDKPVPPPSKNKPPLMPPISGTKPPVLPTAKSFETIRQVAFPPVLLRSGNSSSALEIVNSKGAGGKKLPKLPPVNIKPKVLFKENSSEEPVGYCPTSPIPDTGAGSGGDSLAYRPMEVTNQAPPVASKHSLGNASNGEANSKLSANVVAKLASAIGGSPKPVRAAKPGPKVPVPAAKPQTKPAKKPLLPPPTQTKPKVGATTGDIHAHAAPASPTQLPNWPPQSS